MSAFQQAAVEPHQWISYLFSSTRLASGAFWKEALRREMLLVYSCATRSLHDAIWGWKGCNGKSNHEKLFSVITKKINFGQVDWIWQGNIALIPPKCKSKKNLCEPLSPG